MKYSKMEKRLFRSGAVALACAALIGLGACSGGGGGLSTTEEEALRKQVAEAEAAEEAAKKAEAEAARKAEEERRKAAEAANKAEEERKKAETAEEEAEEEKKRADAAEQAELRARASAFGAVLDLGAGGSTEQGAVTVSWPRGGSLTFRPQGTLTAGSEAPSVPGSWRSASFTGQTGTATSLVNETVYLYTNIQAPGTRAFWKKYGFSSVGLSGDNTSLAKGSTAQAKTNNVTENDTTTTNITEITVSGSFDGAGGKFTCANCSTTDVGGGDKATSAEIKAYVATQVTFSQGRPTFVTPGDWTFKPSSLTSGVPLDQDDAYLYFGIWSSIPDNITGTYNFRYVAGGGAESGAQLGNFGALTGSATFSGGAVGRYVTQGQVGQQNAKIGTFTATATLNADFGDDSTPGTLSGSITDFKENGSPLTGWQVALGGGNNSQGNADVGVPMTISGAAVTGGITVANIGGLPVGGSWGATFHGSDNVRTGATSEQTAAKYPPADLAGVTGWFDATSTAASLAGAFAATPK